MQIADGRKTVAEVRSGKAESVRKVRVSSSLRSEETREVVLDIRHDVPTTGREVQITVQPPDAQPAAAKPSTLTADLTPLYERLFAEGAEPATYALGALLWLITAVGHDPELVEHLTTKVAAQVKPLAPHLTAIDDVISLLTGVAARLRAKEVADRPVETAPPPAPPPPRSLTPAERVGTSSKKGRGKAQRSLDLIDAMYSAAKDAQPITGRGIGYKQWELNAEASDYFGLTDSFARACSLADAEARDRQRKPAARPAVAESTLEASDYLVRLGDPKRLEAWLSGHSASERVGIIAHIEKKSGPK